MLVRANKVRQHNSFCAGANEFRKDVVAAMSKLIRPKDVEDLERLLNNIYRNGKYQTVGRKEATMKRKIRQRMRNKTK